MTTCAASITPSPTKSALLGFLNEVRPESRFAIYPVGRYTRACLESMCEDWLETQGRRLVGFIDDNPVTSSFLGRPVATLSEAIASWSVNAIILLRDTHNNDLIKRIDALRRANQMGDIRVITQPSPTLDAMGAHLGSYSPGCLYHPTFVQACRRNEEPTEDAWPTPSTLLCTLDAEVFVGATDDQVAAYPQAMREFCDGLTAHGYSATLCVQLNDSPGRFLRTPDTVVEIVIDAFGPGAIALHGIDHDMPVEGYELDWLSQGIDELSSRYGVTGTYWAPPGWTLNWHTLDVLGCIPQIRAIRGIWGGVNVRQDEVVETFRFPYRLGGIWQIPYSYVDWMFLDYRCRLMPTSQVYAAHMKLAQYAGSAPCLMETIAHPFRLTGVDSATRVKAIGETLAAYAQQGVRITKVADAYAAMDAAARTQQEYSR